MEIKVCIGSACHLKGSYDVIKNIKEYLEEYDLENMIVLKSAFCLGNCSEAVSVQIDDLNVISMSPDSVHNQMEEIRKNLF